MLAIANKEVYNSCEPDLIKMVLYLKRDYGRAKYKILQS